MECETSILIRAPLDEIFRVTADLENWPRALPHYRRVRVLQRDGDALIVSMAARRGWIPIRWTSRFEVDAAARELRFRHLKAFTRGMEVKWTFQPQPDGSVRVGIHHRLDRRSRFGRWFARRVIGDFFIHHVAGRTLAHFKRRLEGGRA
jgi:aromatase